MNELAALLIKDIKNAYRLEGNIVEETEQTLEDHFAEIENYLSGSDSGPTFGDHCGLESQYFPPADFFTDGELLLICSEFDQMMLTYNLTVERPENVSISLVYAAIIKTLDTQTSISSHGTLHLDFCSGYAPDCFWKEYCHCLEFWNNLDHNGDIDITKGI